MHAILTGNCVAPWEHAHCSDWQLSGSTTALDPVVVCLVFRCSCFLVACTVQLAFDAQYINNYVAYTSICSDCALRYLQQAPNARAMLLREFKLTLHAETPALGRTMMSPLLIDGDPCEPDDVHIKILHRGLRVYV